MKEPITSYVGLDIHKVHRHRGGRGGPDRAALYWYHHGGARAARKALRRCADARHTLVVYEAGPCGHG